MTFSKNLTKIIVLALFASLVFFGCQSFNYSKRGPHRNGIYHPVKKGQTLYRIAKAYGVEIKILKRINRISDPADIKVGKRLFIPGARRVLPVPATDKSVRVAKKSKQGNKFRKNYRPVKKAIKGFLIWPVKGTLTSRFGKRNGRNHDGIDIGAKKGTTIVAAAAGKVVFSGWGPTGYGKMVIIKHKNHLTTVYAHVSKNLVKKKQQIKRGQKIALVGSTGRSSGAHLHFEVRNNTHPQNPLRYLPKK